MCCARNVLLDGVLIFGSFHGSSTFIQINVEFTSDGHNCRHTEAHVVDLLSDLIHLDFDAADAYQAAIDRIKDQQFAATLRAFKDDHLQHVAELSSILSGMGHEPPEEPDMKSLLTRGKVIIGS